LVIPDNLTMVVNAPRSGVDGRHGIVEGTVAATAEEKAMVARLIVVPADDLALLVDALRKGLTNCAWGNIWKIKRGEAAVYVEETVSEAEATAVIVVADYLAIVIDAVSFRAAGQGIIERGDGIGGWVGRGDDSAEDRAREGGDGSLHVCLAPTE
jgi:hypothetical protein